MKLENVTNEARKRRFEDACGTAHGLELLGDRWALLIVRELMLGPRRFSDLRSDLPGISANILTQRLADLEANGIVRRERLPPPANVQVYGLSEWGYQAEPIIQELGRWAARSPRHDPRLPISAVSILLSLRTMIDRSRIGNLRLTVAFHFRQGHYAARIDDGGIHVRRGEADRPDLIFAGPPEALAAFVHGKVPPEQLSQSGFTIGGEASLATAFANLFQLPPKFSPPAPA